MVQLNQDKILADSIKLFSLSPAHRQYTIADLDTYLLLPIKYGTIRLYYRGDTPIGLTTWCWMHEDKARLFLEGKYHPTDDDFNPENRGGKELWGMEFIAPYGDTRQMFKLLRDTSLNLYQTEDVYWRRDYDLTKKRKGKFR